MADALARLGELTELRDRERLDAMLVSALRDIVGSRSIAMLRSVGEAGRERWLTRARLVGGEVAAHADPEWIALDSLPVLDKHPLRLAALRENRVQFESGPAERALFPVSTEREVVAVIEIETERALTPAQQLAVAGMLRVFGNFEGLLDFSERDPLTGLLNRNTFERSFVHAAIGPSAQGDASAAPDGSRRAEPHVNSQWLAVIDIDHFKRVNDRHGHLIGDEVLLLLSRLMRTTLRSRDRLYRFGGEEFVALIRCDSAAAAASAFERVRRNVECHVFPQVEHITVSLGYTELRHGDSSRAAFERADRSVYYAKEHGRNQTCHYSDLIACGALAEVLPPPSEVELF